MFGFAIDFPELFLHEFDFDFVFPWVVEHPVAELHAHDEPDEAEQVGPDDGAAVEFAEFGRLHSAHIIKL